jgi:3-hydroxybutyryl-CoA dehydratase
MACPRPGVGWSGKTKHAASVMVDDRNQANSEVSPPVPKDTNSQGKTMQVGDVIIWERTFSEEDVRLFAIVSGDQGIHHMQPDEQGRLLVHGLLTATLPTKLGGDLNYIARQMVFDFLRPVFTGDTIRCEVTITHFEKVDRHTNMAAKWVCYNQKDKEVLTGTTHGIIRNV